MEIQNYKCYLTLVRTREDTPEEVLQLFPNEKVRVTSIYYAKRMRIRYTQRNTFADIILLLQQKRVSNMTEILRLDDEGIIRAAGYSHYVALTFEEKKSDTVSETV